MNTAMPTSVTSVAPAARNAIQIDPGAVRAIRIEYRWDGLSRIAPLSRTYELTPSYGTFTGQATFVVAARSKQPFHDQLNVSVPKAALAEFLATLGSATPVDKPYEPPRALDDYPYVAITLDTAQGVILIQSESIGPGYAPWKVTSADKTFVIDSDIPNRALNVLGPYLHEDVLQRLIQAAQAR